MTRWLAALLVAAALVWVGVGSAQAQDFSGCADAAAPNNSLCPSVSAAISGMQSVMNQQCADALAAGYRACPERIVREARCLPVDRGTTSHDCDFLYVAKSSSGQTTNTRTISRRVSKTGCPDGQEWNLELGACDAPCSSRSVMSGGMVKISASYNGDTAACDRGCKMMPVSDVVGVGLGENPSFITFFTSGWAATGESCAAGDFGVVGDDTGGGNDGEQCTQQDNLTQCMKPDGRHCAVASSGKEFCWQPGENGIKASGNDAATKSPQGKEAKPPPLPPNNGGDWEQKAQSTVVESKDGASSTSNVTSWESSYGSQGQGASGNGASGEGKGGSGSGSGLGGGSGNGDGDGDGDDGAGGVGDGAGDFYTSNGKTVSDVFQAFKARVTASPLIDAVQGFFTVSAGGACPTFTVPASEYWEAMTYDAHCSGDFLAALQAIGWVLMAVAALAAAYWALS